MASDLVSIASKERKFGMRNKFTAFKHKTSLAAGEPTDPSFEDSFGDQLSDLSGRHRWILAGSALQKWHQDLRDRVGEVLRDNEGEIYKGRSMRGTATLQHCWMMGYDRSYAHPTVIISCDQAVILKRTMRAISQHGILKAAKFALKGIHFCDLKLRTEPKGDDAHKVAEFLNEPQISHEITAGEGGTELRRNFPPATMSSSLNQSGESPLVPFGEKRMTDTSLPTGDEETAREGQGIAVNFQPVSPALRQAQHPGHEQQASGQPQDSTPSLISPEIFLAGPKKYSIHDKAQHKSEVKGGEDNQEVDYKYFQESHKKGKGWGQGNNGSSNVNFESLKNSERELVPYDLDSSDDDELPLRFGAEEIIIPHSGRSSTLGGFLMVDNVCFGLTTAHAFTEEGQDLEQRQLEETGMTDQLYDSDWANEDSDTADDNESVTDLNIDPKAKEQQLQRPRKKKSSTKPTYESSSGEGFQITAKSRSLTANGLDWALCDLGDSGNFSLNGAYLPLEHRGENDLEYLLFSQFKPSPPFGKVLVATKRGVISGLGTGSECSIRLGRDDRYRHVWSIQVEQSLSSGDSGSWVVDAVTGDVYGIIVAGSTTLCEEYLIPAFEIGQDICRVMRAEHVRLPNWQDVRAARTEQIPSWNSTQDSMRDALGWESVDSGDDSDERPLNEEEKRFLLAEVLKTSSIDTKILARTIKDAEIRPKWTAMSLPKRRSLKTAQRAVDYLLADSWPRDDSTEDQWAFTRPGLQRQREKSYIREISASTKASTEPMERSDKRDDDNKIPPFEDSPVLLDSNPSFRAEMSRRAWRAKRRADQSSGTKASHRKHRPRQKSGEEPQTDPILKVVGSSEKAITKDQSKLEGELAAKQGRDDPDILILKHKGSTYMFKFPPSSIADRWLLVGDLRHQAAKEFGIEDASKVLLVHKGKRLKFDTRPCQEEGLEFRSEVLCVIKRTPYEEVEFLSNKFRTELVPQGLEFISDTPDDARKRDLEYKKISETILAQIVMQLDEIDPRGDDDVRNMRRQLITEVQSFLEDLDRAANKDSPAAWHADFIEPKKEMGPLPIRPSFSDQHSSGSRLRRRSTRDVDDPEDLALSDDETMP